MVGASSFNAPVQLRAVTDGAPQSAGYYTPVNTTAGSTFTLAGIDINPNVAAGSNFIIDKHWNEHPTPFVWTKKPADIIRKALRRGR